MMNWESSKTDRIVKRYWSGVMEFEMVRWAYTRKREEDFLTRCVRTEDWRSDWRIEDLIAKN